MKLSARIRRCQGTTQGNCSTGHKKYCIYPAMEDAVLFSFTIKLITMKEELDYLQTMLDGFTKELQRRDEEVGYQYQAGICLYINHSEDSLKWKWLQEEIAYAVLSATGKCFLGPCYNPEHPAFHRNPVTRHQAYMPRIVFLMSVIKHIKRAIK
jgi:hypothetical protein